MFVQRSFGIDLSFFAQQKNLSKNKDKQKSFMQPAHNLDCSKFHFIYFCISY